MGFFLFKFIFRKITDLCCWKNLFPFAFKTSAVSGAMFDDFKNLKGESILFHLQNDSKTKIKGTTRACALPLRHFLASENEFHKYI